jgi:hypothetical protein
VRDSLADEGYVVGETLGDEVGKVDGGVDADGCECCGGVGDGGGDFILGDDTEVWDDSFEPGIGGG